MSKLYPPIIERTLPAFYGNTIKIPFQLNKAVGWSQISQMALTLKNVQNNTVVASNLLVDIGEELKKGTGGEVTFNLKENPTIAGLYYKAQIAFVDEKTNTIGYYSDVGVVKCTTKPTVTLTSIGDSYIATYSQEEKDYTEKIYSYRFDLLQANTVIESSGECLHNSSLDTESFESQDWWQPSTLLMPDTDYTITYSYTTLNGLRGSVELSWKESSQLIDSGISLLIANAKTDEGYIELKISTNKEVSGTYLINRSSSKDGYVKWQRLCQLQLNGVYSNSNVWRDFLIEQGITYKYSIQAKTDQGLSQYVISDEVFADFEDVFLHDEQQQLCIKFNPKISSFKTTIQESKIDTLGGKHPFFFRNGNISYKEFSISGLLSFWMDFPHGLFIGGKDAESIAVEQTDLDTNLTGVNFQRERAFKLQVLDWLNNGKPKLFRSAAEGNYIVRLMNVSLSPNDTLGRMLHTFTATAYEIAEYNYENLKKYGFIKEGYTNVPTPPEEPTIGEGLVSLDGYYLLDANGIYLIGG